MHFAESPPTPGEPLAWERSAPRELLRISWPIAISTISYSVMTLVDTLFVGRLGPSALAAVGLGGMLAFTLSCFSVGLLRAVKTLVAQASGAGRAEDARGVLGAGLIWAAALGVGSVFVGQLLAEALPFVTATDASGALSRRYMQIRVLGMPAFLLFVALRESRYGLGDGKTPMLAALLSNGVNIALDYVLIFGLDLGVAGAAWASVAGHLAELAVLAARQRGDGFGFAAVTGRKLAAVYRLGWASGLQFLLEIGAFAMLTAMLAALSEREMAAHQIAVQILHFSFLPMMAISEATSVMAGQAVGAGRFELVRAVTRAGMGLTGGYALVCMAGFFGLAPLLASAFTDDPGLRATAVSLLYVAAVFQIADAANMVIRGVLRGTGDVQVPAAIGIATAWMCTPPLTYLFAYVGGLGALGGWLALMVELFVGALILWPRLARGGWRPAAEAARASMVSADPVDPVDPVEPADPVESDRSLRGPLW